MKCNGKIAIVTGAGRGLGRGIARKLAQEGAVVVACDVALENVQETVKLIDTEGGKAKAMACNVASLQDVEALFQSVIGEYGQVDVLVNNAGIGSYATWEELSDAELRREVELDFLAPVALTKELLGCVAAARGAVINISSAAAYIPVACMGAYNAVKAALRMFSVTLQMEVAGRGVHVLNVCPGRVDTGFSSRALGGRKPPETPGRTSSSAEVFARKVFNAYRKRKRELVYPGWYWFAIVFARWFPGCCERINRRVWQLK